LKKLYLGMIRTNWATRCA